MSISNMAFTAGMSSGNPYLMAAGAGGMLLKGILGSSSSRQSATQIRRLSGELADVTSDIAATQNQIFEHQFSLERENLLLSRRRLIRQGLQQQAGLTLAAQASGQGRSTTFGAVQQALRTTTEEGTANIDRALTTGEQISSLSQNISTMQAQQSTLQAQIQASAPRPGLLQSIL